MTGGREHVLARIRTALADVPHGEQTPRPTGYRRSHASEDVVGLFAERVADYRAGVFMTTRDDVARTIDDRLAAHSLKHVIVPAGFPPGWLPGGSDRLTDEPQLSVAELDAADAVLTTAVVGIAVTGTIVLDAGAGQGRRALSLLPDHHLCVLLADQIVGDMPQALERLDPSRPLTFVSGPSATSDIELDRVEGVHGPRTLDIVIVLDTQNDLDPNDAASAADKADL